MDGLAWKAPLSLKIKIFTWQLLQDRLPSGVEVAKQQGRELCLFCGISESGTHIMFTCTVARFLWSFVHEGVGLWLADQRPRRVMENRANATGKKRRLFWSVFATMSWTLWTIRNKMVTGRVFPHNGSNHIVRCLVLLQQWYCCVDKRTESAWTPSSVTWWRRHAVFPHRPDADRVPLRDTALLAASVLPPPSSALAPLGGFYPPLISNERTQFCKLALNIRNLFHSSVSYQEYTSFRLQQQSN
jgi:hypothetical protein